MDQNSPSRAVGEPEREQSPFLSVESSAGFTRGAHYLNRIFAKFDLETLRYLFPNNSYVVTCQASGNGRRCKTPSLKSLWMDMNDSEKVVLRVSTTEIDYLVSAKLLRRQSAWFSKALGEHDEPISISITVADAGILESLLVFMCTGILKMPLYPGHELKTVLQVSLIAYTLKMETLEWCAVGRLEEYFETNPNAYLPRSAVENVLQNTGPGSHLREWLADHVAVWLCTGTICAGALAELVTTAPDFATGIMISMQTTAMEMTNAFLYLDISEITEARREVIDGSDREDGSGWEVRRESDEEEFETVNDNTGDDEENSEHSHENSECDSEGIQWEENTEGPSDIDSEGDDDADEEEPAEDEEEDSEI